MSVAAFLRPQKRKEQQIKYIAMITYTAGERTGATVTANSLAEAWEKVFDLFGRADVRGVELAAILTPERSK